jgi:hypothetical protein
MNAVLGRDVDMHEVKQRLIKQYGLIFSAEPEAITMEDLPWS